MNSGMNNNCLHRKNSAEFFGKLGKNGFMTAPCIIYNSAILSVNFGLAKKLTNFAETKMR